MVKITFKNVGQGDSIILEWKENSQNKIGIIDCNLTNSTNPILDHIIKNKIAEIEFLILSHPHYDHFSGFKSLLEHCRTNQTKINSFFHTALSTPDYLKSASRSVTADNDLFELFFLLKTMKGNNEIKVYAIDDNPHFQLSLGNEFKLESLAPSSIEIDKYIRGVKYPFDEEHSTANPNANWLCTVFKIYNDKRTIILTSDVESSVLSKLGKKKDGRIGNDKLILGQAPHHGSKKNLNKVFWTMRKRNQITPIAISVGKNSYNHPSDEVIEYFNGQSNYEILRTDSLDTHLRHNQEEISNTLNIFSSIQTDSYKQNDIVFEISGENIKY